MAINFKAAAQEARTNQQRQENKMSAVRETVYEARLTKYLNDGHVKVYTKIFTTQRAAAEYCLAQLQDEWSWKMNNNFTLLTGVVPGEFPGEYGFEYLYDQKKCRVVSNVWHKHIYTE